MWWLTILSRLPNLLPLHLCCLHCKRAFTPWKIWLEIIWKFTRMIYKILSVFNTFYCIPFLNCLLWPSFFSSAALFFNAVWELFFSRNNKKDNHFWMIVAIVLALLVLSGFSYDWYDRNQKTNIEMICFGIVHCASFGSKATAKWTDFHRLSLSPCFPAFSSGLTGDSPKRGYLLRFCGSAKLYAVASEGRWATTVVEFCAEPKFLRCFFVFLFAAH